MCVVIPYAMGCLQELAIQKIIDIRPWKLASLKALPWVLENEILRRECMEHFSVVLEELFRIIMTTQEWMKLSYIDRCIQPSVVSSYCGGDDW